MNDSPRHAADIEYFEQVESCFARLRGTPLLLSPKDWALVASWREQGVPLRVVLETLESVFASRERAAGEGTPRPVLSLGYCRHAVQEAFEAWREAQLGAPSEEAAQGGAPGGGEALDCLQGWIERLELAGGEPELPTQPLQDAVQHLQQLADLLQGPDAPSLAQVEEQLEETEDRMLDQLRQALPLQVIREVEELVRQELEPLRPRLTRRAYESTFQVHLRARLRARHNLPRLTLY